MTETNNNIKSPVSYGKAQRFLADFHFCYDYWQNHYDDCMNVSVTPVYNRVLGQLMQSLLESSEAVLDELYDAYPAEFLGYCSDKPQRQLTKSEQELIDCYLTNHST